MNIPVCFKLRNGEKRREPKDRDGIEDKEKLTFDRRRDMNDTMKSFGERSYAAMRPIVYDKVFLLFGNEHSNLRESVNDTPIVADFT